MKTEPAPGKMVSEWGWDIRNRNVILATPDRTIVGMTYAKFDELARQMGYAPKRTESHG